jgi:hypothetical protein
MSDDGQRHRIVLRFSEQELETLERAIRAQGDSTIGVADWIRQIALRQAQDHISAAESASPSPAHPAPGPEPPPSKGLGECRCGQTSDIRGECDGSCSTRF